jgi:hypothetical protein
MHRKHRDWFIHVSVRLDEDGAFTYEGFVRKPNPYGARLSEISFKSGERHPTEQAPLTAAFDFGKKKIDDAARPIRTRS